MKIHINHFTVLVYGPPELMLLAVDLDEYFIDVKGVAETSVPSLKAAGINRTELNATETDRFAADGDTAFREKIFDIAVAEVESMLEPDGIGNNVRWESMAFIGIHPLILPRSAL